MIRFFADYEEGPVWSKGGSLWSNDELPVSDALRQALKAWVKSVGHPLDHSDDRDLVQRLYDEGVALALQLQQELGSDYDVLFEDNGLLD